MFHSLTLSKLANKFEVKQQLEAPYILTLSHVLLKVLVILLKHKVFACHFANFSKKITSLKFGP